VFKSNANLGGECSGLALELYKRPIAIICDNYLHDDIYRDLMFYFLRDKDFS